MKKVITLTKKELRDFFGSPIAYVFITVFLALAFGLYFSDVFLVGEASLRVFFSWLPVLFIVFLPAVTMGRWSDEKKSGTYEILMTLPVRAWQVILGKYLACAVFLLITLLLTTPLAVVIAALGDLDWGMTLAGYAGIFFLGLSYLALGLFFSSLTKNQIVAFIVSVAVLFLFYIIAEPIVTSHLPHGMVPVFHFLSFSRHFASMARGVVDSRDVIYFVSTAVLFLYCNRISIAVRKLG